MKTILRYFALLLLFCLSPALAKPEWLHVGLNTKTITSKVFNQYVTKDRSKISTSISFTFKNNSRYQAILGVKNPTFYVSGYIETKTEFSKWGGRQYFKDVKLTSSTPKTVEIFPGQSSNITYGSWTFAQITGQNIGFISANQARIILTKVSAKCSLTTRETQGSGLVQKPNPKPNPVAANSNGVFKGSSSKLPPWLSVKRTKYSFVFKAKPLTMNYIATYTVTNKSSLYAIASITNRRIKLSKMRYVLGNKSYNCGTTSATVSAKDRHLEVLPGGNTTFSITVNLIPFAKTPANLFNAKVREGSKSNIKFNVTDQILFDFTYIKR